MNRYAATGFLTRDPEQRALPSGSTVCQMRLAVKGMGPNYATGYIDVAEAVKDDHYARHKRNAHPASH